MKILKWILGLFALLLAGGFFMPGLTHIERNLTIYAPASSVFSQLTELKNWQNWSPWYEMDPNMQLTYSEPSVGIGAFYTWDSKTEGKGKMTILDEKSDENVHCKLEFDGMGVSTADFKLVAKDSTTTIVRWSMDTDHGLNPISRYMGAMMDKIIGPAFEKGLNNLKTVTEKQSSSSKI